MTSLYHLPLPTDFPVTVTGIIEIPKGSRNKYEYDAVQNVFRLDRVLSSPLHYNCEYGFVPQTLAGDGDPVDVLVPMEEPTFTGCVLLARPIGLMRMVDESGEDFKILALPMRDRRFEGMNRLGDVAPHLLKEIEHFFTVYKALDGLHPEVAGWEDEQFAHAYLRQCHEAFVPTSN
ncbi:MAG: inorganic diphosphatase [Candidatus Sericytochromatia bacterium]|nr:inorganic diphosphatase [Candidatus Sericytochromatia bacterium]